MDDQTISALFERLEYLNRVGIALSRERELPRLLDQILLAAKHLTAADGGTLYRVTSDRQLCFEIFRNDTLGLVIGGAAGGEVPFSAIDLYEADGAPASSTVAAYTVHHESSVRIADAYTERGFDFSGTERFDRRTGYRSRSFLTVPMKNHENEIIGVLQLLNAKDSATGKVAAFSKEDQQLAESLASQAAIALTTRLLINHLENLFESFINLINARDRDSGAVVSFTEADQRLVESLASQAAIAWTIRQLIDRHEQLFESFIRVINGAIDRKSPHTGGHCLRVPELTMMIADAVAACDKGPLASFAMTEGDRYELKLAGLLHDCGKVTTPVHVVDKATKLQTITDRIELIATRFEVLKRDAQLAALRGEGDDLAARLAQIADDLAFLRRANVGSELMSAADIARVHAIAERYPWRGPDRQRQPFLTADEVANLTIPRGTLTAEERGIINHHIVVTIEMLEALPWPKHLVNVPIYAGAHHERVDGNGYPRGLTREQMPVAARCMAIADIFEALTAGDRPYKKAKTLTEALAILGNMKLSGHIDPDIFDVFMWERVYERYARAFLPPEQRDAVDPERIPGYARPPSVRPAAEGASCGN